MMGHQVNNDARRLVIETASEACSVALFEGERLIAHDHRVLGRGHAEALVPMIADLPERGKAQEILVSLGPGSFTGVRIGIASARALGVAWGAQVLGYPSLALIAAIAREETGESEITVCINGGHGEFFVQNFGAQGPKDDVRSLPPEAARTFAKGAVIAGNKADALAEDTENATHALSILPDARKAHLLNPDILTHAITPIYGRGPDAIPQKQRSA